MNFDINIADVVLALLFYYFGYWRGAIKGRRQIIEKLNIPKGSEISAISFRKKANP